MRYDKHLIATDVSKDERVEECYTESCLCLRRGHCWRRLSRRRDCQVAYELDLASWRLPPFPDLGMYIPLVFPAPRSCYKDTTLRQKCGVEAIWIGYVIDLVKASYKLLRFWWPWRCTHLVAP